MKLFLPKKEKKSSVTRWRQNIRTGEGIRARWLRRKEQKKRGGTWRNSFLFFSNFYCGSFGVYKCNVCFVYPDELARPSLLRGNQKITRRHSDPAGQWLIGFMGNHIESKAAGHNQVRVSCCCCCWRKGKRKKKSRRVSFVSWPTLASDRVYGTGLFAGTRKKRRGKKKGVHLFTHLAEKMAVPLLECEPFYTRIKRKEELYTITQHFFWRLPTRMGLLGRPDE